MIKVLHCISDSNIGGAGKWLETFINNADREQFEISVVLPCGSLLKEYISKIGVKIYEAEGIAEKSLSLNGIQSLCKIIKEARPDILHTHASFSARIAARLCGNIKVVYTRHSVFEPSRMLTCFLGRLINGFVNRLTCDRIIAVAEAAKKNLTDTGIPSRRITVIYNGIDTVKKLSPDEIYSLKEKYLISSNDVVGLISARLTRVKGHRYLLHAIKRVSSRTKNVKFIIAGTGEEEASLKKIAISLKIQQYVIFTGFVKSISDMVNISDFSINTSYGTEAASLALLEGMSLGKCAVVSDYGGNPELIINGINGFVVPKRDYVALSHSIFKLVSDNDLRNKMGEQAKKIFEAKFTAEIMTKKVEAVYNSLLNNK